MTLTSTRTASKLPARTVTRSVPTWRALPLKSVRCVLPCGPRPVRRPATSRLLPAGSAASAATSSAGSQRTQLPCRLRLSNTVWPAASSSTAPSFTRSRPSGSMPSMRQNTSPVYSPRWRSSTAQRQRSPSLKPLALRLGSAGRRSVSSSPQRTISAMRRFDSAMARSLRLDSCGSTSGSGAVMISAAVCADGVGTAAAGGSAASVGASAATGAAASGAVVATASAPLPPASSAGAAASVAVLGSGSFVTAARRCAALLAWRPAGKRRR